MMSVKFAFSHGAALQKLERLLQDVKHVGSNVMSHALEKVGVLNACSFTFYE